jgi:hypothetical protein
MTTPSPHAAIHTRARPARRVSRETRSRKLDIVARAEANVLDNSPSTPAVGTADSRIPSPAADAFCDGAAPLCMIKERCD